MAKRQSTKWLARAIRKITDVNTPDNISFTYYGKYNVTLQSGTQDYVSARITDSNSDEIISFDFDYLAKRLNIISYPDEYISATARRAFIDLYGKSDLTITDIPAESRLA